MKTLKKLSKNSTLRTTTFLSIQNQQLNSLSCLLCSLTSTPHIFFHLFISRVQATKVSTNFRRWLLTNPSCYLFASERVTELLSAEPTSPSDARGGTLSILSLSLSLSLHIV
jgi:hypothetical protein